MFVRNGLFTSESVSEGHPDKLADRVSGPSFDAFLERPIYFLTAALGRSDLALPWETQGRTGTPGRNQEARP